MGSTEQREDPSAPSASASGAKAIEAGPKPTTLVLGAEYDKRLQRTLRTVLSELGGRFGPPDCAIAGSQELTRWRVDLDGAEMIVEAETYIGLSLHGPRSMVERVAAMVRVRMD